MNCCNESLVYSGGGGDEVTDHLGPSPFQTAGVFSFIH